MRSYVDSFDSRVTSKANEVSSTAWISVFPASRSDRKPFRRADECAVYPPCRDRQNPHRRRQRGHHGSRQAHQRHDRVIDTRAAKLGETHRRADRNDRHQARQRRLGSRWHAGQSRSRIWSSSWSGERKPSFNRWKSAAVPRPTCSIRGSNQLSDSIKTNSTGAERALTQLAANTTEALGKSAAASTAATEALNRSAAEATVSLNRSAGALSNTSSKTQPPPTRRSARPPATAAELLAKTSQSAADAITRDDRDQRGDARQDFAVHHRSNRPQRRRGRAQADRHGHRGFAQHRRQGQRDQQRHDGSVSTRWRRSARRKVETV